MISINSVKRFAALSVVFITLSLPSPAFAKLPFQIGESVDSHAEGVPYQFGINTITPLKIKTMTIDWYFGTAMGISPAMSVPMPLGFSGEIVLPHLAYCHVRGSYDMGIGMMKLIDDEEIRPGLGFELIAGYPLLDWSGTANGKWGLESHSTFTRNSSGEYKSGVSITYVNVSIPKRTYLIPEAGIRRNIMGLAGKFAADGSTTLLFGGRFHTAHNAHILTNDVKGTYDVTSDGLANLWAHILVGHFGSTEPPAVSRVGDPLQPTSSVGFEIGYSKAFWLTSLINMEGSAGISPTQGMFLSFGMSYRFWNR